MRVPKRRETDRGKMADSIDFQVSKLNINNIVVQHFKMCRESPQNLFQEVNCGFKSTSAPSAMVRDRSTWRLTGRVTEELIKSHRLEQSVAEFLPSSPAAHLERIPVLHQQLGGEVYPGTPLSHRLGHQLSHRLSATGPRLAHHESEVTSHSGAHHVQNSGRREMVSW